MTASTLLLGACLLAQIPTPGLTRKTGALPSAEVPDGLGVNIHFTDPQPGEMERWAEAGYHWVRTDLTWAAVEREKGKFDFSAYDRLVDAVKGAGGRILFILDYGNDLYDGGKAPASDEAKTAFLEFAAQAGRHFAGKQVMWEIWNEPNLAQFWKPAPDPTAYAKLAVATARTLRASDPDATVIGPGTSGFPWEYLEQLFRWGLLNEVDAVSVHPYRESAPETVVDDYGRLRALIARYSTIDRRQLPLISSEWGYSTANGRLTEDEQASYLVRQWLVNLSQGIYLSVFYDWKDDGADPAETEHRFGTVRQDLTPKPSFEAAKKLISALNGYSFRHRLFAAADDPTWRLLFQKGDANDYLLVSWQPDSAGKRSTDLPKIESVGSDHPNYKDLRTLAMIRIAPGAIAEIGDQPDHVPLQVITPTGAPIKIIATIRQGTPNPRFQFDGPSAGALGLPLAPVATRAPHRYFLVKWAEGEAETEFSTLVDLWRADPLELAAVPDATGVRVSVKSPARKGFKGLLQVMTRQPPAVVGLQPVVIGDGDEQFTTRLARPAALLDYYLLDEKKQPVTSSVTVQAHPLAGFPTAPGVKTGWSSVLSVDNKAEQTVPVAAVALDPTAPSVAGLDFSYQFEKGWRYVSLVPNGSLAVPAAAEAASLWVLGDLKGDLLRTRLRDATGQVFQIDLPAPPANEWTPIRIPLNQAALGTHWGGDNDGVIHKPLTWEALLVIDSASRETPHGGHLLITAPFYLLTP